MSSGETLIDLELNISRYSRNVAAAAAAARKTDQALADMSEEAKEASDSLNEVSGNVTVKIKVNTGQLTAAEADVSSLDRTVAVTINTAGEQVITNAKNNLDAINTTDPDVKINTTGEQALTDAKADLNDINTTDPDVDINVDQRDRQDIQDIKSQLETIKNLAVINFVVKGLGMAKNAIAGLADLPIISTIADLDEAVRRYKAAGGEFTEATRGAISDEFSRGLAESPQQVAEAAAALDKGGQGGDRLAASLQSVYDYATLAQKPVEDTVKAALQLVATGQAADVSEAVDLLATGFQNGADKAGDMLDVVGEFSGAFRAVGIDGAQQIALLDAGLDAGARNASVVADAFKGLGETLRASLTTGVGDAGFDALASLGLTDLGTQVAEGKKSGAELAMSVVDGVKEQIESGAITPVEGNQLIAAIFGGSVDELGVEVFKKIDFASVLSAQFDPAAVETAVAPLRGGLVAAAQELGRVLESEIAEKFRIAGQPLQDLLDNAPQKMRELADLIRGGMGIPESLEIVLQAPGLADTIHDFEIGFTRAIIEFLNALSQIVALIPGANPEPLRETVANLTAGQLQFELLNADSEAELAEAIQRAVDRGVTDSQLSDSIQGAAEELVASGQIIAADTLVQRIQDVAGGLDRQAVTTPGLTPNAYDIRRPLNISSGLEGADQTIDAARTSIDELSEATTTATPLFESMWDALVDGKTYADDFKTAADEAAPAVSKLGDDVKDFSYDADTTARALQGLNRDFNLVPIRVQGTADAFKRETPAILLRLEQLAQAYERLKDASYGATTALGFNPGGGGGNMGGGGGGIPVGDTRFFADGGRPPAYQDVLVGEQGAELATFAPGATIINNANTETLMRGLAAFMASGAGGFGGGAQNVYNSMNVVINTGNEASAFRAGAGIETAMRGFQG